MNNLYLIFNLFVRITLVVLVMVNIHYITNIEKIQKGISERQYY